MSFDTVYQYWEWEMELLKSIQQLHADWLTPILNTICNMTMHGELWVLLTFVFVCIPKTRKMGVTMAVAMALGSLAADVTLKPLVQRPRPFESFINQGLIQYEINEAGKRIVTFVDENKLGFEFYIKTLPKDWSFPSGHSVCGFAASVSIFSRNKKAGIAAILFATTIAFSRMYLFVHFPTDVLAGILIGTICAVLSYFIVNAIDRKLGNKIKKKRETVQ